MLVIISDLHFTDGTTSNWAGSKDLFNVNPDAFKLFFAKISNIVARRGTIRKVTVLYNGDIFDPLRTQEWFNINHNDHPWSIPVNREKVHKKCLEILHKIVEHNEEALLWLSGAHNDFNSVWKADSDIERVYIPGNHDRMINLYKPCRELVHQNLLGRRNSRRFNNLYVAQGHQTLAMHGHESDPFNCEYHENGDPNYALVPIGDPMTTMLFVRLGYEAQGLSIPEEAKRGLREVDNVRPALSVIRYVQDVIKDYKIASKVEPMMEKVVSEFEALPFYRQWQKRHDRWNVGYDEADKLQIALRALKLLGASVPAGVLERLAALVRDEACQNWAKRNLERVLGRDMRHCVLGHTHEPLHCPLFVDEDRNMEKHYLNSGTFRATYAQTFDKQSFLRHQRMSFVIIYGPNEFSRGDEIPAYEMWSGLRMHH